MGIVCPVYNVEFPMMVREFIRRADIHTDYFFVVFTYGEGIGEAFAHAKLAAEEAGLSLSYVNAIQMVDNFIPYFDMQEQIERLPGKNVEGQIEKLLADIAARKKLTLDWALEQVSEKDICLSDEVQRLMDVMKDDVSYSGAQLMEKLSLKSRDNFRKRYLLPALKQGFIAMRNPDKPTSRNQTYMKK